MGGVVFVRRWKIAAAPAGRGWATVDPVGDGVLREREGEREGERERKFGSGWRVTRHTQRDFRDGFGVGMDRGGAGTDHHQS